MDKQTFKNEYPDLYSAVSQMVNNTTVRVSALEQKTLADAQKDFLQALTSAVPNWQAICREDPDWPVWLAGQHRYSTQTKLDLLKEAFRNLDSSPVINLLKGYLSEKPQATPKPQPAAEIITRSFINKFYHDKVRGVYQTREKEAQAIEARINGAIAAGRVR